MKRYAQENCKYTFSELEETVLELESVDLKTIQRFAMRSKRWMLACMEGLAVEQRAYAEKVY